MSTLKVEKIQHPNSASVALTLDTSGYLALQAGSASTPAIQGPSDPNTGIFFPAADTIAFAEGGTEVLRIDSSGRVGIGTSSVTAGVKLQVADGTASKAQFNVTGYGGLVLGQNADLSSEIDQTSSGANFFIKHGGTAAITVDTSRRVGIGTTPETTLDVNGAITLRPVSIPGTGKARIYERDTDSKLYIQTGTGNAIRFLNSSQTDLLNIDSSGRLLVGTTSSSGVNSNTAPVLAGNFTSFTGTVLASHVSPTTLFALENLNATYIVTAMVAGTADATNYYAVSLIGTVVSNSRTIIALKTGGLLSISLSGGNVQGTQNSGVSQYISWSVIRIANL